MGRRLHRYRRSPRADRTDDNARRRRSGWQLRVALATEDRPERYEGSLTGTLEGSTIVLRLQSRSGAEIGRRLTLAHPLSYAEQAVYGVVDPTPALKLGGGVLAAWKFKQ